MRRAMITAVVALAAGQVIWSELAFAQSTFGPSGGHGGSQRSEVPAPNLYLKAINIRAGQFIDAIQFVWADGAGNDVAGTIHGGEGGTADTVWVNAPTTEDLIPNPNRPQLFGSWECLVGVSGTYGAVVDNISFHLREGTATRTAGPYGGGGGAARYRYDAPPGYAIIGLFVRSGHLVDAIGVILRRDDRCWS